MKIAIVVPEYNEGTRVVDTVKSILKLTKNLVIVVDDGSGDDSFDRLTGEFMNNGQVAVLRHIINIGKGAAMETGVRYAWRSGCDAVIFVDADGQHNPRHLIDFERGLVKNDLVFGYRSMGQEMPTIRKLGNIFSVNLIKGLFKLNRKDLLCGYFGFKKSVYKKIKWKEARYGVETEIACRVAKNKLAFVETKVDTIYIDKYKGVSIFDAFNILIKLPVWYFRK